MKRRYRNHCSGCGKVGHNATRCEAKITIAELREVQRARRRFLEARARAHWRSRERYQRSEKGRARQKRYKASEKGRASQARYEASEKSKARYARYRASEKGRARARRWRERQRQNG